MIVNPLHSNVHYQVPDTPIAHSLAQTIFKQ